MIAPTVDRELTVKEPTDKVAAVTAPLVEKEPAEMSEAVTAPVLKEPD